MPPPMGRHTTLDPEMRRAHEWLQQQAETDKTVLAAFRPTKHSKTPGTLQVKGRTGAGLKVIGYSGIGLREIFVYTTKRDELQRKIEERFGLPSLGNYSQPKTVLAEALEKAATPRLDRRRPMAPLPVPVSQPSTPLTPPAAAPVASEPQRAVDLTAPHVSTATQYVLMEINPDVALDWLTSRNPLNRKLSPKHVARFERILREGQWNPEAGVVMFDPAGNLLNGQHRLTAIFNTGVTVRQRVALNVPTETRDSVDTVLKTRTDRDLAHFRGDDAVKSLHFHILVRLLGRGRRRGMDLTPVERQEFLVRHRAAIDFAVETVKLRRVVTSPALAVVARASYSVPAERLKEFGEVLSTGFAQGPQHHVIIMLRNYLQAQDARQTDQKQLEIYQKTERALYAFLRNETLSRLYKSDDELFLIPDEAMVPSAQDNPA